VSGWSSYWIILFSDLFYGQRIHTNASVKTVQRRSAGMVFVVARLRVASSGFWAGDMGLDYLIFSKSYL